jgi:hypothetical protein
MVRNISDKEKKCFIPFPSGSSLNAATLAAAAYATYNHQGIQQI